MAGSPCGAIMNSAMHTQSFGNKRAQFQSCISCLVALLLSMPAIQSCSGSPVLLQETAPGPVPQLRTLSGSDWQAEDLKLDLRADADGSWLLELDSQAAANAGTLLLEAYFSPDWQVLEARQLCAEGELNLLVSGKPGVLALGVIMPATESLAAGPVLRARLVHLAGGAGRSISAVPGGDSGLVPDLHEVSEGTGFLNLDWTYRNRADYDQNSEVNIADLTALAQRLGQSTLDGELDELDSVLDGDGNTEVNIADITPLGINFLNRVSGYRIYGADGADPLTATAELLLEVPFAGSTVETNSRRRFSAALDQAILADWSHLYIRPWEESSGAEGIASNVLELTVAIPAKFRVPAAGDSLIDSNQSLNPSLVLLPAISGYSEAGAPVIVYTTLGGGAASPLLMAYYGESGWVITDIGDGANFSNPQLRLLPAAAGELPQMLVVAYSVEGTTLVERRYDSDWQLTGSQDVGSGSGVPTHVSLDMATDGALGVAHAYAGANGTVRYSWSDGTGAWDTQELYSGPDTIVGLSFRFDPAGGDSWLIYTHGTIDTSAGLLIDLSMEQARLSGTTWTTTHIDHPDSPLVVSLGFRADNTPQLAITSVKDYTIEIPSQDPLTLSLLVSVDTMDYDGFIWNIQRQFESSFNVDPFSKFFQGLVVLSLDLASEVSWARSDELLYNSIGGDVDVSIATQQPEGGTLTSESQYMTRGEVNIFSNSSYYGGSTGRSHAWSSLGGGTPSCAYVQSGEASVEDLLAGNFSAAGELAYWRP